MTPLSASLIRALVNRALATSIANGPRASLLPNRANHGVYAQQQAARLRAQQAECTFEPKLDARSARLVAAKSDARRPVSERLYEQQAEYMNRRVLAQMARRTEEEKECTFKPAIKGGGGGGMPSATSAGGAKCSVPHSHAPHARKPPPVSSEEAELQMHCTFKPRLNH